MKNYSRDHIPQCWYHILYNTKHFSARLVRILHSIGVVQLVRIHCSKIVRHCNKRNTTSLKSRVESHSVPDGLQTSNSGDSYPRHNLPQRIRISCFWIMRTVFWLDEYHKHSRTASAHTDWQCANATHPPHIEMRPHTHTHKKQRSTSIPRWHAWISTPHLSVSLVCCMDLIIRYIKQRYVCVR